MQETAECLDRPVRISAPRNGAYAGRRLRALARLVSLSNDGSSLCLACLPLREGVMRMFRWEASRRLPTAK
jgi:hypothetical protein